jgi:hypothetical protein
VTRAAAACAWLLCTGWQTCAGCRGPISTPAKSPRRASESLPLRAGIRATGIWKSMVSDRDVLIDLRRGGVLDVTWPAGASPQADHVLDARGRRLGVDCATPRSGGRDPDH